MKNEPFKHINFDTFRSPLEEPPFRYEVTRIAAQVADLTDRAITEAIIEVAKQEGITDLYLIDKRFILEAIEEKMKREKNEPLTLDELRKMKDATPVWWQVSEKTGLWCLAQTGVVMVPSGRCYDISECEGRVYRHKPREDEYAKPTEPPTKIHGGGKQ